MRNILVILSIIGGVACDSSIQRDTVSIPTTQDSVRASSRVGGFVPTAGEIVTRGIEHIGDIQDNTKRVSVDAEIVASTPGPTLLGLQIEMVGHSTRATAFVDDDELTLLLQRIDSLRAVRTNPTRMAQFEIRIATRGGLEFAVGQWLGEGWFYQIRTNGVGLGEIDLNRQEFDSLRILLAAGQSLLDPASVASPP